MGDKDEAAHAAARGVAEAPNHQVLKETLDRLER